MPKVAICPTVTAFDTHEYRVQMELLERFAERIHIDLMDGQFAPHTSTALDQIWWPPNLQVDLHLMYVSPTAYLDKLITLRPRMVIIHFESKVEHNLFTSELHNAGIKAGLAILQTTSVEQAIEAIPFYDDVMIFSGNLGEHGGVADLDLLQKADTLLDKFPGIEISWDGGISDQNIRLLIDRGVSVLNVGGYIHKSSHPQEAYAKLKALIKAEQY